MSVDDERIPGRSPATGQALSELDLRALPKVELHRHLEGAIRLSTIIDLSREAGVPLPADTPEELAAHALIRQPVRDLGEALARFAIAQNAVRSYEAVTRGSAWWRSSVATSGWDPRRGRWPSPFAIATPWSGSTSPGRRSGTGPGSTRRCSRRS